MKKDKLLSIATKKLLEKLGETCISHNLLYDRGRGTFRLVDGTKIYLRYNNYGQYSYVLQFSAGKLDRIRFDNYDEQWDVETKPHHKHQRNTKNVNKTKTTGRPEIDIDIIFGALKENSEIVFE